MSDSTDRVFPPTVDTKDLVVKSIVQVTNSTQTDTSLLSADHPLAVVAIDYGVHVFSGSATGGHCLWAVTYNPDSRTPNTLDFSNGGTTYSPEQNLLEYGITYLDDRDLGGDNHVTHWQGTTRMEPPLELKVGDQIYLSHVALSSADMQMRAVYRVWFI